MALNKKQLDLMYEWGQKHSEFKEKILWIGCNPSDPEIYKKQAEDGFKLMREFGQYTNEMMKKINDAGKEKKVKKKTIKSIERDLEIISTGKLPESPEDRFRTFLTKAVDDSKIVISEKTGISKLKLFGKKVKTNDLVIFKPNGSKKIIKGDPVDKILDQVGLTNAEKLRFKFEKDFPGKKAIKGNSPSYMFREWLVRHHVFEDYFKYGDYKDEPIKH